jgi:hypothetical protein
MLRDLPVRGPNGRHEPLRRPPTLVKRAEKTLWDAFQAGRPIDFRQNGSGHANGTGNGNGNGRARAWIYGPALPAEMIIAILRADPGQNRSARLELTGARITGAFDLSYARITHPITLRECEFDEPVVLADARLASLTLDDCTFPGLQAPNLEVDGDLGLSRVASSATVRLTGARLQRDLVLRGAHLHGGTDAALAADHLAVEGSVLCDQGFEATGGVTMEAARVTGSIRLDGAKITGDSTEKVAFDGDGMTVGHEFRAHLLHADGQVSLVDVTIANALELRGARLNNPGGAALRLHRAEISSSLYCDNEFKAAGSIEAIGTHVKGSVYFNDAELGLPHLDDEVAGEAAEPPAEGSALLLARMTIDGDLGCWRGFAAHLPIDLGRLSVGAEFQLCTTALAGRPTSADLTSGRFGTLTIMGKSPAGFLDLTKAKTEFFCDSCTADWADDRIVLDDFEYGAIQISPVSVKEREQWLLHAMMASARKSGWAHHGYLPQPYDQLAVAYRRAGDDPAARLIQLAKYRRRNSVTKWRDRWYSKVWNNLQDTVIGYGYAPRRALSWLLGLFVLGVVVFRYVSQPYSVVGHHHFTLNNSIAYTLDLLLPTSGLQERQVWQSANGLGEVAAAGFVICGWVLTATVFAAAARVLQRN